MAKLSDAFETARALAAVLSAVMEAIGAGQPERVDAILPLELRTSLKRKAKELQAADKFGPRPA